MFYEKIKTDEHKVAFIGSGRNARAKGKRLGRPRIFPDLRKIAELREEGLSWAKIAERLECGEGTVYRAAQASAGIPTSLRPVSHCSVAAD